MTKERETWIDIVKGIAILMVMWGHVQTINTPVKQFLSMFYVQVFLVITGFLFFKKQKKPDSLKDMAKKVLIPYISFSLLAILVNAIVCLFKDESFIKPLIIDTYKTLSFYGIMALWYLPSYFFASFIFLMLNNKVTSLKKWIIISILMIISILFSFLLNDLQIVLSNSIYNIIYFPLASIGRIFACVLYIAVGFEIGKHNILNKFSRSMSYLYGLLLLVITFLISIISGERNFSMLNFGSFPLALLIGGVTGSFGLILLLYKQRSRLLNFLQFFGKNSLLFLITHMTFKINNLSMDIVSTFLKNDNVFFSILSLIIMLIIEIPIVLLISSKLRFLLYGFKKKDDLIDR